MSDGATTFKFTLVFTDELRAAAKALHVMHDGLKSVTLTDDEKYLQQVDALNACLVALWHVEDTRPVLLMDQRDLALQRGANDPRGATPEIHLQPKDDEADAPEKR